MSFSFTFTSVSRNRKTGSIPTTRTDRKSCPSSCPFYNSGCYAQYGPESMQWNKMHNSLEWSDFLAKIRRIPYKQLWRHNTAGDLPHIDGNIIVNMIRDLISANKNRRGFTYTHHQLSAENVEIIKEANHNGFTINVSTESIKRADYVMSVHKIPAVAVVNSNERRRFFRTNSGRKVILCPAVVHENVNCSTCGICANPNRESIVAFPSHGPGKYKVNSIID